MNQKPTEATHTRGRNPAVHGQEDVNGVWSRRNAWWTDGRAGRIASHGGARTSHAQNARHRLPPVRTGPYGTAPRTSMSRGPALLSGLRDAAALRCIAPLVAAGRTPATVRQQPGVLPHGSPVHERGIREHGPRAPCGSVLVFVRGQARLVQVGVPGVGPPVAARGDSRHGESTPCLAERRGWWKFSPALGTGTHELASGREL